MKHVKNPGDMLIIISPLCGINFLQRVWLEGGGLRKDMRQVKNPGEILIIMSPHCGINFSTKINHPI